MNRKFPSIFQEALAFLQILCSCFLRNSCCYKAFPFISFALFSCFIYNHKIRWGENENWCFLYFTNDSSVLFGFVAFCS